MLWCDDAKGASGVPVPKVHAPARYQIKLIDTEGYENADPVWRSILLARDQPPSVSIVAPGRDLHVQPGEMVGLIYGDEILIALIRRHFSNLFHSFLLVAFSDSLFFEVFFDFVEFFAVGVEDLDEKALVRVGDVDAIFVDTKSKQMRYQIVMKLPVRTAESSGASSA